MGTDPSHFACHSDQQVRTLTGGSLGLYSQYTQLVKGTCHNSKSYALKEK